MSEHNKTPQNTFGITEARKYNYTGPQEDFSNYNGNTHTLSFTTNNNSSSSGQVDWSGLVDNVFKEEIDKLAYGYQSGKF